MPSNIGVCSQVELRREWEFLIKDTEAPGPGAIPHPAASQASGAQLGTAGFLSEDSPQGHESEAQAAAFVALCPTTPWPFVTCTSLGLLPPVGPSIPPMCLSQSG